MNPQRSRLFTIAVAAIGFLIMPLSSVFRCGLIWCCAMALCGCRDADEIVESTVDRAEAPRPFVCTVPENWRQAANDRFSVLAFEARGRNNQTARVTVSSLDGHDDDFLLSNLNRWRQMQLRLPPVKTLKGQTQDLALTAGTAKYVELITDTRSIHGAMVVHGGKTWFFKLDGSPTEVLVTAESFKTFLKSLEFIESDGE